MQRSKWYALLFLLGAFVAGAAVGVASDRMLEHSQPGRRGPRGVERMARELNLTAVQRAAFDTILESREKQIHELFAPIKPGMDSLMDRSKAIKDSTHEQLRRVLTPAQRAKFDKMSAEMKKRIAESRRRHERDRPGNGPGRP